MAYGAGSAGAVGNLLGNNEKGGLMATLSRKRALELFRETDGARIVRYWNRGGTHFDFQEWPVPERIAGWRKVDRVTASYVVFDGGSHLHPATATSLSLDGSRVTIEFDLVKIEYELKGEQ